MVNLTENANEIEAVAQHIEAAACLIEECGWTRKELARDEEGEKCEFSDPVAAQFCMVGALLGTSSDVIEMGFGGFRSPQTGAAKSALFAFLGENVMNWNDFRAKDKRDAVVHMLDCAAALRKGEIKV